MGNVMNNKTGRILTPNLISRGYIGYKLYTDGIAVPVKSHRLVAEAFLDNPFGYPQVNHLNGIKSDNRASNLEWCTNFQNAIHAKSSGLYRSGSRHTSSKLTEIEVIKIRSLYTINISLIAKMYSVDRKTIRSIRQRKTWRHI
jgi:hypothetical protein